MAQVWIRSSDMKDLVRAESVAQISIWTGGKSGYVGLVRELGKDAVPVAEKTIDFGTEPFDDEIVLNESDLVRAELVDLIHRWEIDQTQRNVTLTHESDKWIVLV